MRSTVPQSLLTVILLAAPLGAQDLVTYTVEFEATWSDLTHPEDFPDNPHFSGLIGGTHDSTASFWTPGELASDGIEDMAERGRKSPLDSEVQAAIDSGSAEFILSGSGVSVSPGTVSLEFEISHEYPLVTLVSMLAPSPDWFVGVHGLSLRMNGSWIDEIEVPLYVYDAGTDSGESYTSPNEDTDPPVAIQLLNGGPFSSSGLIGSFRFRIVPQLALTAILEGPYVGGGLMETSPLFADSLPTEPPYPVSAGAILEKDVGKRGSVSEFPENTIDWVLVSLRSDTSAASEIPGSRTPALLSTEGSITSVNGGLLTFDGVAPGAYYIVLAHRNHLGVMSSQMVEFSNGYASWDFTAGQDKVFGTGLQKMASLEGGLTGLFSGDATADGQVTAQDFNLFLRQTKAVIRGYAAGDFDLDGQVTATDFNIFLGNTKAAVRSYVP